MIAGASDLSKVRALTKTIGSSAFYNFLLNGWVPSANYFNVSVEFPKCV